MNYISLNGVKSTTIKGLLIQSLPPISKPLMRTQVDEIDGRDGDIVTHLGYSAYDKEIEIGLYGDYNVDDVIAFFNSTGTVVFSNEPDKYYNYQIVEQIDFEKLIRFRTATVTMHVQPFKYSAVDQSIAYNNFIMTIPNYTQTQNGVTVSVVNGVITVSGKGTAASEFYIPTDLISLDAGNYTLGAYAEGSEPNLCSMRLIYNAPSSANTFGGEYAVLQADNTVSITAELTEAEHYNYIYLYILAGVSMNFSVDLTLKNNDFNSISLINRGNVISKPKITIYGKDAVNLSVNGIQAFVISLGNEEYITIDAGAMEAYKESELKNRLVVGDYGNLVFKIGTNTISWSGDVTKIEIEDFSRWI